MGRANLVTHIIMITVAGAIVFLYILPTIRRIKDNQDTVTVFKNEVAKVSQVNTLLDQKVIKINSIPLEIRQKLTEFVPDAIDELAIMRTLEAILIASDLVPLSLSIEANDASGNSSTQPEQIADLMKTVTIATTFETNQETLYKFFQNIQTSSYPFVIKELSITPAEGTLLAIDVKYKVNSLDPNPNPKPIPATDIFGDELLE